jgi:phosphate-selective porin OprO and OprP
VSIARMRGFGLTASVRFVAFAMASAALATGWASAEEMLSVAMFDDMVGCESWVVPCAAYDEAAVIFQSPPTFAPSVPEPSIAPALFAAPECLPEPQNEAADEGVSSLAARLAELEAKYDALEQSQDDLKHELEHYSHPRSKDVTMIINGRIHVDVWTFPDTSPGANGFETGNINLPPEDRLGFRRIRFGAFGDIYETMQYRIDFEFADGDRVETRDIFLGFKELPVLQTVLIGKQKRPMGLDHWNSSNFNVFLERPFIVESFNADSRRLGIQSWSHTEDKSFNWQYGVFNQGDLRPNGFNTSDNWQPQIVGRLANTLWYDESSGGRGYAHWAVSGTFADTAADALTPNYAGSGLNQARFRTRPEARTVNNWLDTGIIPGADHYQGFGLEHVLNLGPTQLTAEYQSMWVDRENAGQLHFHGAYVYWSYFLTGEHMTWERDTGQLGPVDVFENFFLVDTCRDGVKGGWGAWQIAARASYGDLSDEDIQGGIGESLTLGLNWYWNKNARMQFNYIYGNIYDNALNAASGINYGTYQIIGTRFGIYF